MTAIRFILLKISILICFSSFGQINDTWDAVKVGTTDMQKIYVGSTLVWEKGGCEYGDLNDYNHVKLWRSFTFTGCSDINTISLQSSRAALDAYRNVGCTTDGISGKVIAIKNYVVDNYVLKRESGEVICVLDEVDMWGVTNLSQTVGESIILHMESGIITYVEYY